MTSLTVVPAEHTVRVALIEGALREASMMYYHTAMPKAKVALTLDADLLEQVDELVAKHKFRNRSQAVEAALADKLQRMARTRLAREAAKLNPSEEKRLADEGLVDVLDSWPEY
jgi:Arc/MetJ-type ribon-helix-helix transcriptional regulator